MSQPDFSNMTSEEFAAWKASNQPSAAGTPVNAQTILSSPPQNREQDIADTTDAWLNPMEGKDFRTPSGKLCRLRELPIDKLAAEGVLDQLTRLPGLTEDLIQKSEGQPPSPGQIVMQGQALVAVLDLLNKVIPLVVVQPEIFPIPDPEASDPEDRVRQPNRIYPDSISFQDRMAILNEAAAGVAAFDSFRK